MIEPKNLAKAMRSAAKGGGYKILLSDDEPTLYIWNDIWAVAIDADSIPRLVLATIVEQTGEIPKRGSCGIVTKDGVQMLSADVAKKECRSRTAAEGRPEAFVRLTPIRYRGMLVYQTTRREIYATNGAGISIAEGAAVKSASVHEGGLLVFSDEGERLALHCFRPVQCEDVPGQELCVWEALASCDLGTVE